MTMNFIVENNEQWVWATKIRTIFLNRKTMMDDLIN